MSKINKEISEIYDKVKIRNLKTSDCITYEL